MVFWRETGTKEDEEEVEVLDILDAEGIIVATDIVYKTVEPRKAQGLHLATRKIMDVDFSFLTVDASQGATQ